MPVLFALAVTAAAVLASSTAAAALSAALRVARARRRASARAGETALVAAAAQRWRTTPAAWGGPSADGFAGASLAAFGLPSAHRQPGRWRTESGVYRLVHVPACPTLDRAADRAGHETGGDGLLAVGWDPATGDDTAVVVLGPLLQIPLARVPWAWIAALDHDAAGARESPSGTAGVAGSDVLGLDVAGLDVAGLDVDGPAVRRTPALRVVARLVAAPDRPAVPPLRLVSWPERPSWPVIGAGDGRQRAA